MFWFARWWGLCVLESLPLNKNQIYFHRIHFLGLSIVLDIQVCQEIFAWAHNPLRHSKVCPHINFILFFKFFEKILIFLFAKWWGLSVLESLPLNKNQILFHRIHFLGLTIVLDTQVCQEIFSWAHNPLRPSKVSPHMNFILLFKFFEKLF